MQDGTSAKLILWLQTLVREKLRNAMQIFPVLQFSREGLGPHKQVEGPFSDSLFAHNSLGLR